MTAEAALDLLRGGDPAGAFAMLGAETSLHETDAARLVALGMVQLANHNPAEALTALRMAVALGDTSPPTLLNLALAQEKTGDVECALRLMESLELRVPDWDEPPLRIAEALRAAHRSHDAERAYGRALEINPRRESALLGLAGLLIMRGEGEAARDLLLRCCGIAPARAEAWDTLGLALLLTRDTPAAESAFAEAQRLSPQTLEYALHRVDAACATGSREALLAWLEAASEEDPVDPVLPAARGVLLDRLGRRSEAIDALETATALAPDARLPAALLGIMLARSGRAHAAEATLRRASELDPDNLQLRDVLATMLMRMTRHAEARAELLASIDLGGEQVHRLCNLANATTCLGLQDEAVAIARRAIALAPDAMVPQRVLCNTLPYRDGISGTELLLSLKNCSARLPREILPPFANTRDPDRPLVVGLLSGSFKPHPVGWLTVAGFETLDPAAFQVVCLAQNGSHDWMARRFRALSREWHDVDTMNDKALAMKARDLGIDILIDLGGYGESARMTACAYRMAPVQMKWVGMQNHSSGVTEMDWIITDRWETPPELEHVYSERPLRLPDGYVCYSPPPYAPDIVPLPALANGHITFGCFNNLAKVTPRVIATWCTILLRVPGSRMVLKTQQFSDEPTAERVRGGFAAHGIGAERIELRGGSGHRAFMRQYNDIDIVLDPFPYSGGLTTCESLWMGVPTVAMPGEIFASRHSMSHLSNAGFADWVAADVAAYVELAVAKASDMEALAALRSGLRARVKASPLCDAPRFGRNLGAALRYAWQDWCDRAGNRDLLSGAISAAGGGPASPSPPSALSVGAPHLFNGESDLMMGVMLDGHRRYLEFGVGGSTLMAIRSGLESVVAVDSDSKWVDAARRNPEIDAAIRSGRADIRHADIGPVTQWGRPRDRNHTDSWPNYIATAWDVWSERNELPDLIFVDGRFRVACCLSVILAAGSDASLLRVLRVMLHDAGPERPYYDDVFAFFDVVESVNTLRVMKVKPNIPFRAVTSALLRRLSDQR